MMPSHRTGVLAAVPDFGLGGRSYGTYAYFAWVIGHSSSIQSGYIFPGESSYSSPSKSAKSVTTTSVNCGKDFGNALSLVSSVSMDWRSPDQDIRFFRFEWHCERGPFSRIHFSFWMFAKYGIHKSAIRQSNRNAIQNQARLENTFFSTQLIMLAFDFC